MLDLNNLNLAAQAEAGYEFELLHPVTGEGLEAFIKVRGDKSKAVQAYSRKRVNEFQKRQNKGKKPEDLKIEEIEEMAVEAAVIRIISWKGIFKDKQEVPFTPENAASVLSENDWIRQAVVEAAENLENFLPK